VRCFANAERAVASFAGGQRSLVVFLQIDFEDSFRELPKSKPKLPYDSKSGTIFNLGKVA